MFERFIAEVKSIQLGNPQATLGEVYERARWRLYLRSGHIWPDIKFSPDQLRIPRGSEGAGRWTTEQPQGPADTNPTEAYADVVRRVQIEFGFLIAELPYAGGRKCVYRCSFGDIIVEGPVHRSCSPTALPSAIVHGMRLNDNY